MSEDVSDYCGNCGTPNTGKKKFCQNCGTSLINITGTGPQAPAPPIPPKMDAIEKAKQIAQLREKISQTQVKLDNANSVAGPLLLFIFGVLTAIILIGILFIIMALIWYEMNYSARPKLRTEIATLEAQLRELERM